MAGPAAEEALQLVRGGPGGGHYLLLLAISNLSRSRNSSSSYSSEIIIYSDHESHEDGKTRILSLLYLVSAGYS